MGKLEKCILAFVAAAGIWGIYATSADAQERPICAKHADLVEKLKGEYNEVETDFGIVNDQAALVIFTSPEGETWTAVMVGSSGRSCVLSAGEHWSPGLLVQKGDPA